MAFNKIYIPTFISSIDYKPARVLPHIYFYNGTLQTNDWYIENNNSGTMEYHSQSYFPYFDNYQGNLPSTSSLSLLFNNETAPYGEIPTASLYSEYWSTYVNLLYYPTTRLIECSAIIPLADYFKMELNDIVEWRGNYYHLRAINDYNLSNGECNLQLLGPILPDTIANIAPFPTESKCEFNYEILPYIPPTPTSSLWDLTSCDTSTSFYGVSFDTTSSLSAGQVIQWGSPALYEGCWTLSTSSAAPDLTGSIVYGVYVDCAECTGSTPPVNCISCSEYSHGEYSGVDYYVYPTINICSSVSSSIQLKWDSYERPNRFAVYDSTGQRASTGWVGYANYAGPWGLSLNTAQSGYLSVTFASSTGRYLIVETGGAGPSEISDAWDTQIIC